jgi:hypothetical protein
VVDGFATSRAGRAEVLAGALLLGVLTLLSEGALSLERVIPAGVRGDASVPAVANQGGAAG